ncbi:MAG: hypothetical protein MJZ51_05365 [Bacteroidales bacterium]|nr:hypothetical protein [Bacteroidales bacterium]
MKKLLTVLSFVLLITSIYAQERIPVEETWKAEEIRGSYYHGFVFHKNWEVDFTVESQDGRFTPSDLDIAKAEALIKKRIAYVNRNHENQEGKCPIIDEHMLKYERQYVGFTDNRGAHIVWVNFLWDANLAKRLGDDIILTTGGCGHFWHVKVNLDTEKVYGLEVNESGDVKVLPRLKKKAPRISRPGKGPKPQRIRKTGIIHDPSEVTF